MFTVIVHIHSLLSQFFHKSRFQLYSTCHDERAAHANRNLAFSFTSPAENQDGWCGDYMEYGPNFGRDQNPHDGGYFSIFIWG